MKSLTDLEKVGRPKETPAELGEILGKSLRFDPGDERTNFIYATEYKPEDWILYRNNRIETLMRQLKRPIMRINDRGEYIPIVDAWNKAHEELYDHYLLIESFRYEYPDLYADYINKLKIRGEEIKKIDWSEMIER